MFAFTFQRPSCPKQTQTKDIVVLLLEIAAGSGFGGSRRELSITRWDRSTLVRAIVLYVQLHIKYGKTLNNIKKSRSHNSLCVLAAGGGGVCLYPQDTAAHQPSSHISSPGLMGMH